MPNSLGLCELSPAQGQMTFKIIITFSAVGLLVGVASAGAQSGPCPAGTCAKNGGAFALNVKYCSKSNCGSANSQIRAACQARYGGPTQIRARTTTGMSVAQCIQQGGR